MPSRELFTSIFVPEAVQDAVSDAAWVRAMLDAEAALAAAEAEVGIVPPASADAIAEACTRVALDPGELGMAARGSGNPVPALVRALREAVGGDAAHAVHFGAASQDALDSAAMLVAHRALGPILAELDGVAAACARMAHEHRGTLMAGRTLLQQALPVTFGLKAAVWLSGVTDARARLRAVPLAAQLGGAAGTLAALGDRGPAVLTAFSERLGLDDPGVPWHAARGRVAELGAALEIALDITLLAQTEVAEVSESGGGDSSAMPHKRNPAAAIRARGAARSVRAAAGVLLEAMAGEHERAAGAWHSEWAALTDALAGTGGAAACVRESLEGLTIHTDRMRTNLDATGDLLLAEHVALLTGDRDAVSRAIDEGRPLGDVLRASRLDEEEIERALDPATYLGAADEFIDRALAAADERGQTP